MYIYDVYKYPTYKTHTHKYVLHIMGAFICLLSVYYEVCCYRRKGTISFGDILPYAGSGAGNTTPTE